jgi:putative tryptophan/tyrosine transport system substrate-binding protein
MQQQVDLVVSTFDYVSAVSRVAPVPVVLVGALDPVASGLVPALDHPGGTVTGVLARPTQGLLRVHMDLLLSLIPNLRRVAFVAPFGRDGQVSGEPRFSVPSIVGITGVQVHVIANRQGAALGGPDAMFAEAGRAGAEAIIIGVLSNAPDQLAQGAVSRKLPILYQGNPDYPRKYGGLMSQGVDVDDVFRRAGGQIAKVLDGVKPGDLPFEEPDKYNLVVNMSAAQAVGLTVPSAVLNQATEVIP